MSVTLVTSLGELKLELYCEQAPRTSRNFLALAASGAYDGCQFHRNIASFIIQGGDPTGSGSGGAAADGGRLDDEIVDALQHDRRGRVAMANRGPNTAGSQSEEQRQTAAEPAAALLTEPLLLLLPAAAAAVWRFFICYAPCPHLNAVNTVFAQVIGGLETLEAMERAAVDGRSRPLLPIRISSCRIHANPFAEQSAV